FHPYEVREIRWPELSDDDLARLRALPFWGEAVSSERTASARVRAMADVEPDPVLRDAIALQGYEEGRHAALLETMLAHYGIEGPGGGGERPRDAEWGFLRMGYGECFDSFFAFGLFRLAADSGIFPAPLVARFDGVMQEEARHILFFTNWVAYRRLHLPFHRKARFLVRRGPRVAVPAIGRVRAAPPRRGAAAGDHFTTDGAGREVGGGDSGEDLTRGVGEWIGEVPLRTLAETCLAENERRLAVYDTRLLRPHLVPRLVRQALRLAPKSPTPSSGDAPPA